MFRKRGRQSPTTSEEVNTCALIYWRRFSRTSRNRVAKTIVFGVRQRYLLFWQALHLSHLALKRYLLRRFIIWPQFHPVILLHAYTQRTHSFIHASTNTYTTFIHNIHTHITHNNGRLWFVSQLLTDTPSPSTPTCTPRPPCQSSTRVHPRTHTATRRRPSPPPPFPPLSQPLQPVHRRFAAQPGWSDIRSHPRRHKDEVPPTLGQITAAN